MTDKHSERLPLVTVGMTAWNAEETLPRALVSAFAQDWPRCEFVAVDDGSTDGTPAILKQAANVEPRLRIVRNETNRGVAASRNRLIEEARGEFLCFFDDDDTSEPGRVWRQVDRLLAWERGPEGERPAVCHAARMEVLASGRQRYVPTLGMEGEKQVPCGEAVALMILTGRPLPGRYGPAATCTQMARTALYREMGGFDEAFRRCEDTDFNIRLALRGGAFPGLRAALVTQYITAGPDKNPDAEIQSWTRLWEKHRDFLEEKRLAGFSRRWLAVKFALWRGALPGAAAALLSLCLRHPIRSVPRMLHPLRMRFISSDPQGA